MSTPSGEHAVRPGPRQVQVRLLRAAPRVYLSNHHQEQVLGSPPPEAVWHGLLGETMLGSRVTLRGGNRKEVQARVMAPLGPDTLVALPHSHILQLELRHAPAWGEASAQGVAISGPRGAVVVDHGVVRAAPRLVLPPAVAQKAGWTLGLMCQVELSGGSGPQPERVRLEVSAAVKEAVLVVDAETSSVGDAAVTVAVHPLLP